MEGVEYINIRQVPNIYDFVVDLYDILTDISSNNHI